MSRKAIVHIGGPKTGSTTIQRFLADNRVALLRNGFAVPDFLGTNHHWLSLLSYDPFRYDELRAARESAAGLGPERAPQAAWASLRSDMRRRLVTWAGKTHNSLVLTNEHLQVKLEVDDLRRFSALMEQVADDVSIIVYVREPISRQLSAWSTYVKGMGIHFPVLSLPEPGDHLRLDLVLPRWEETFPGAVKVRLFDNNEFFAGDLVRDFCQACGIPWDEAYRTPRPQNESISWPMMRIMNAVNRDIPGYLPDGTPNPRRSGLINALLAADVWDFKYLPSVGEVARYRKALGAMEEWLIRRYFPDRSTLWSRTPTRELGTDDLYCAELSSAEEAFVRFVTSNWPRLSVATRKSRLVAM